MLKLYIAPQCPFCPNAVRTLTPLITASDYVYLSIIDGTMFTEMSASDGIRSAPTVALDEFRWTGSFQLEEVVDIMVRRDPTQLSPVTIQNLIQEGSASRVAQLMLKNHSIFKGFIDILTDEKWPIRLGAMATFEEIIETDPGLASQVISPLWSRLPSLDDQTKGDMIYLIGETGNPDTIPRLLRLESEFSSDELKTIVREAIERIKERYI
jgi:glutaredoxin